MRMPSVLVTGASTGIGKAICLVLAERGYSIYGSVRRKQDADELRAVSGGLISAILLDVRNSNQVIQAASELEAKLGPHGLQVLVNNAGIAVAAPLEVVPIQRFQEQLDVNVTGMLAVTQAVLPLIRRGRGRVINIGSISGRVPLPFVGPYAASKSALAVLTRCLRMELRPWQVPVVLIEPGNVTTAIWEKSLADAQSIFGLHTEARAELYQRFSGSFFQLSAELAKRGMSTQTVVNIVLRAVEANCPREVYTVGCFCVSP